VQVKLVRCSVQRTAERRPLQLAKPKDAPPTAGKKAAAKQADALQQARVRPGPLPL
jgi:hypothetical protein